MDIFAGDKTAEDKTEPDKIVNPFGSLGIIFVAFYGFNPLRVGNDDMNPVFQKVKDGDLILSGRFHADIKAGIIEKQLLEMTDIIVESRESLFLVRRLEAFGGFDNCGNEKSFIDIDITVGCINTFMGNTPFVKLGAIDCHTTHLTRVKTILRLRTRSTTYLYSKDMAYTD